MSEMKRFPVVMNTALKMELEAMSEEIGLTQNHLTVLALYSLVANYKKKGSFIMADLLNPEHRS